MYNERSPLPNIWLRLPSNTPSHGNLSQLVPNAQFAVISFSTQMTLSDPGACTWTATFVATPSGVAASDIVRGDFPNQATLVNQQTLWYNQIQLMDLVGISISTKEPYFIGCVMSKSRTVSIVSGKPVNTITLSGIALGGVFSRQNILYLPILKPMPDRTDAWGILANTALFGDRLEFLIDANAKLAEILKLLFNKFLSIDIQFAAPAPVSQSWLDFNFLSLGNLDALMPPLPTQPLADYMDVDSGVSGELNTLYYCNRAITAFGINSQVSLWQKAREFVPAPWFEAWFDYDPLLGKAVLYARRPPFSWEDWNAVHNSSGNIIDKIVPSDVVKEELGVNSSDVMSIFFPSMSGVFLGDDKITALYPPLISSRLMKKFGIVMFQPQVTFAKFSPDEHDTGDIFKMMDTLREQCAEWYSLCDEMESGSLTIKGRTDLRIGDKVRLYSSGNNSRDFYVEGVGQSWSLTSPWCTELTVTRGLPTGRLQQTKNEVAVMKAEFATVQHYTDDPTVSGGQ